MYKSLVALAILSAASAPVAAQTAPAPTQAQAQAQADAKPQMVKKRVCYQDEEDSYSRLGGRKICKTIEVPATPSGSHKDHLAPAPNPNERG